MPPSASGPVLTVSRPNLNGAPWAIAGIGNLKDAAAAPAAVPAMNLRRLILRDIPCPPSVLMAFAATSRPVRPYRRKVAPSSANVFHDVKPGAYVSSHIFEDDDVGLRQPGSNAQVVRFDLLVGLELVRLR